ncbi:MAG: hypothetical protein R3C10_00390 [Pirellulales bacterium]
MIVAWTHCGRAWGNTRCPCLHSDPVIPDCPAGETRRVVSRLSFYAGDDIDAELARIDATDWASGNRARIRAPSDNVSNASDDSPQSHRGH